MIRETGLKNISELKTNISNLQAEIEKTMVEEGTIRQSNSEVKTTQESDQPSSITTVNPQPDDTSSLKADQYKQQAQSLFDVKVLEGTVMTDA